MLRKALLSAFFVISCSTLFAQTEQKADTITTWLSTIAKTKEDTNKVNALIELGDFCANVDPLRGIQVATDALTLAQKLDWRRGIYRSYANLAKQYAVMNIFPSALENFNKALSQAEKNKDNKAISSCLNNIALLYTNKGDFDKALEYYEKQSVHDKQSGIPVTTTKMLNYGVLYFRKKDLDKSIEYNLQALEMAKAEKVDASTFARIYSNLASCYNKKYKFDKALVYLSEAEQLALKTGNKSNLSLVYNNIGNAYKHMYTYEKLNELPDSLRNRAQNLEKSLLYLNKALVIARELHYRENLQKIYFGLAYVYEYKGDVKQAIAFHKEYEFLTDSLQDISKEKDFARVEAEFKVKQTTDSLKYANMLKEDEVKERKLERNIYVLLVSFAGIISVLLINRQKQKHIQKRKIAEELAKQQLEDFTKSIHEKNELIEKFGAEIERYQSLPCSNELPEKDSSLQALMNSVILTEDQWVSFQSLFDKVHTGYIGRAKNKFKDITAAELRFLVLSKLNLTYKEMAGILGVTVDAVRISKHRLLKKIQLPEGADFESVVHSI